MIAVRMHAVIVLRCTIAEKLDVQLVSQKTTNHAKAAKSQCAAIVIVKNVMFVSCCHVRQCLAQNRAALRCFVPTVRLFAPGARRWCVLHMYDTARRAILMAQALHFVKVAWSLKTRHVQIARTRSNHGGSMRSHNAFAVSVCAVCARFKFLENAKTVGFGVGHARCLCAKNAFKMKRYAKPASPQDKMWLLIANGAQGSCKTLCLCSCCSIFYSEKIKISLSLKT
jgi:hypothetical protein